MNKSYWQMLKGNFDSPGEILPLIGFFTACWFMYYKIISDTVWLAAMGLFATAHTINHAVDPASAELTPPTPNDPDKK